jgi:hypothetical protein
MIVARNMKILGCARACIDIPEQTPKIMPDPLGVPPVTSKVPYPVDVQVN